MTTSIIVPIYHGKKYITNLINQAEQNAVNSSGGIELLLVNDDPENPIKEKWNSKIIQINVLDTNRNQGIHGARARGLKYARGEQILFLDQDDRIAPDYIKKQSEALCSADAVVCEAVQGHKKFYNRNRVLQECITREYMVQKGNFIISPGQALIKKDAIPAFWKQNILKNNGADDWFLWLCMLCAGRRFVCNPEILYEHVVHSENTSANGVSMLDSMREVHEKLKRNAECTEEELAGIYRIIKEHENNYIKERDKLLELYFLLDDWMTIREQNMSIADYISGQGCKKVCIYGKGRIGVRLAEELQEHQIEVSCFIDRNAEMMREGIRTILPEELGKIEEPVIITVAKNDVPTVRQVLMKAGAVQIYVLSDIITHLKCTADNCNN